MAKLTEVQIIRETKKIHDPILSRNEKIRIVKAVHAYEKNPNYVFDWENIYKELHTKVKTKSKDSSYYKACSLNAASQN